MNAEQQKAEAKVRKLIPELMELSFGCEVKWDGSITTVLSKHENDTTGTFVKIYPQIGGCNNVYLDDNISEIDSQVEIIGHPIQLQHWLRALDTVGVLYRLCNAGVMYWCYSGATPRIIHFGKDGQPQGERDYKAFNDIVGI